MSIIACPWCNEVSVVCCDFCSCTEYQTCARCGLAMATIGLEYEDLWDLWQDVGGEG